MAQWNGSIAQWNDTIWIPPPNESCAHTRTATPLSAEDLQKSLEIISQSETNNQFLTMLKALGKMKEQLPESPASNP